MTTRYTLDDLMQGAQDVKIPVPNKTKQNKEGLPEPVLMKFWIRPSRQAERDLSGAAARKASRTLRKLLEDPSTEEHARLVVDELEGADIDSLRNLWVAEKVIERAMKIRNDSLEDREYVPEPEGDTITHRDLDEYEDAVDDAEERRETSIMDAVTAARKELEAEAQKIPDDKLQELAKPVQVDAMVNRAYETEFSLQLIFRCTFTDKLCQKRVFTDIEQVYKLRDDPLTILTNAHMGLILDTEAVKNLAGGLRALT